MLGSFFIGFSIAFLGLLPPGMLNMTTMRVTMERGLKEGLKFAFGASTIVGVHSFLAFTFSDYLTQNPQIVEKLEYVGILVFFILAIFFYFQSRKKFGLTGKVKKGSSMLNGFLMSSMNMLGIPFYLGASIALGAKNPEILDGVSKLLLVFGAMVGAFTLFILYGIFSKVIKSRISFIAENINIILSILFIILGVILIFKKLT